MTSAVKYVIRLLVLSLLAAGAYSCTYDYFEDENNFRVYVPQIADRSIGSFFVAVHDMKGKHIVTKHVKAPFDGDELLSQGILRFKLIGGETYHFTCFTDYTPESITEGKIFSESYKGKTRYLTDDTYLEENYGYVLFSSRHNNPCMLRTEVTAPLLGHPDAKEPVTIDMGGDQCFKGKVDIKFIDLPAAVSRIDVVYKGLATKVMFDGNFERHGSSDCIIESYKDVSMYRDGNTITLPTDMLNASANLCFDQTECGRPELTEKSATREGSPVPLELEVLFYDASGSGVGKATFTDEYFQSMDDAKKPTDGNGNKVESLVLKPRETIKFTFKDFLVINIDLVGWKDTDHGTVTPM